MTLVKRILKGINEHVVSRSGYKVIKIMDPQFPLDMDKSFKKIFQKTKDFSMTPIDRLYAQYQAVEYITKHKIPGDIVECGVWKGGSSMVAALTLKGLKSFSRRLFLYDTYEGMSKPTKKDISVFNHQQKAISEWKRNLNGNINNWCFVSEEEVRRNMFSTGYSRNKLLFIKGKVEDTIPEHLPKKIALLRLDTDWYESTKHELVHLYPLLQEGGVLIIDDYGDWQGSKDATDEYLKEHNIKMFLNRIGGTGRLGIKHTT